MRTLLGPLTALFLFISVPASADLVIHDHDHDDTNNSARFQIGPAAHYWLVHAGVFDLDLAVTVPLGSGVWIGGRSGVLLATNPMVVGIPVDVLFNFNFSRFYMQALGGAWVFFEGPILRGHAAFGIGIRVDNFSFGPEVGYLDPDGIVGLRFAIAF